MKTRFTPILLVLVIIVAAILSRFIGDSDYIMAQTSNLTAYKFFYCPYNKAPYRGNPLYPGYPTIRYPYPFPYPPGQYPYPACPCTTPAVDSLLLDD